MDPNSNINPNPVPATPVPTPEPAPVAPGATPATPEPTPAPAPQPVAAPSTTPEAKPTAPAGPKKPLPKKFILIGAAALGVILLVVLGIIFIPKLFKSDKLKTAEEIFSEDVLIAVEQDDKYGFIDLNGKMVIQPQFEKASDFEGDKAIVRIKEDDTSKNAIIDRKGKILFTAEKGDSISYDSENELWRIGDQLYDKNLKKILPEGKEIYSEDEGYYLVVDTQNAFSGENIVYNKKGKAVYKYQSESNYWDVTEYPEKLEQAYAVLKIRDENYTIINLDSGKVVAENLNYDSIWADDYTDFCLYDGDDCSKYLLVWNDKVAKEYDYEIEIIHYGDGKNGYYKIYDDRGYSVKNKHDTEYFNLRNSEITSEEPKNTDTTAAIEDLSEWEIASGYTIITCGSGEGLKKGKTESVPCIYDDIRKPNVMTYEYLNSKGKVYVIGTKDDKSYLLNAKNGKVVKEFPADTAKFHDNSTFVGAFNDDDKYEAYNMVSGKSATLDADYVNFYPMYITVETEDDVINYYNKNFKLFYSEKE